MPSKKRNSEKFFSNHVGKVELTSSGKFWVRARKSQIPTKERQKTVDSLEEGIARLEKLEKLFLKKIPVPLSSVPESELQAADRVMTEFHTSHAGIPEFKFSEIVKHGLETMRLSRLRDGLPTIREAIAWFHEYRATPEAKHKGLGTLSKKEQRREKVAITRLFERPAKHIAGDKEAEIEKVLSRSVGEIFDGTFFIETLGEGWYDFCHNHLCELKTKDGLPMGSSSRSAQAATFRLFCEDVMEHHRQKLSPLVTNPLQTLPRKHRYRRTTDFKVTFQEPDKVKSVFEWLCEDAQENPTITDKRRKGNFHDLIPYFALAYFSGRRQSEIAFWDNANRRLDWSQFNRWSEPSAISGGYTFSVPAFDKKGNRVGKKDYPTSADLHRVGYDWLRYYFLGIKGRDQLPTEGQIYFSADYMKKIRRKFGFEKNDIRHTFVSAAIKAYPLQASYWHTHCAHTQGVALRDYQNLMLTKPQAEEFFTLDPVSVVGWNDITRRLFDPDGTKEMMEIFEEDEWEIE